MHAYNDGEIYKLAETLILYQLSLKYKKKNKRLYIDDVLAVFKDMSIPEVEKIKKHFQKIFRKNDLNIINVN